MRVVLFLQPFLASHFIDSNRAVISHVSEEGLSVSRGEPIGVNSFFDKLIVRIEQVLCSHAAGESECEDGSRNNFFSHSNSSSSLCFGINTFDLDNLMILDA